MLTERTFATGDIILNYAEGPAAGPPLVMLHGYTGWWQSWQVLIPPLASRWHLYALDLRGHGKSGRAGNQYRVTDFVRDTVSFLEHHATQPAILLGRSFGTLLALGAAAAVPDRVWALVLLDPSLLIWRAGLDALPAIQQGLRWISETLRTAQSYPEIVARCQVLAPAADDVQIQLMATQVHHIDPAAVDMLLHHWDQVLEGFDLAAVLDRIAHPTLILRGDPSLGSVIRDEDIDFVHAHLPTAVSVTIPDAGHDLDRDQPEAVLSQISTFLESL